MHRRSASSLGALRISKLLHGCPEVVAIHHDIHAIWQRKARGIRLQQLGALKHAQSDGRNDEHVTFEGGPQVTQSINRGCTYQRLSRALLFRILRHDHAGRCNRSSQSQDKRTHAENGNSKLELVGKPTQDSYSLCALTAGSINAPGSALEWSCVKFKRACWMEASVSVSR